MLQRRRRKSISFPSTSSIPELEWLSKTIKDINFGLQEDFSLPSRIEVSIPKSMPILGTEAEALNIRLIDTRGIDEPSAHREELQDYLDDDRAIIVLCSKFGDAPSADIQALIEKSTQIDLRTKLLEQGLLLVLPREGEEARMVDMTGEPVASPEEGREFRRDQATMTLIDLDMRELPIEFLNVENEDDCKRSKEVLLQLVLSVRQRTEEQVDSLTETVDGLIRDYDNKDVKGCFDVATPPLKRWCANNTVLADIPHRIDVQIDPYRIDPYRIDAALLEAMAQVHVQSLRKSVKCQGEWYKFAYWPSLGFGARRTAVARSKGQLLNLRVFVRVFLDDSKYESTHNFLRHFLLQIDREANAFVIAVQQMCQTAFAKQLKKDGEYWRWCEERWPGTGYRDDVGLCTKRWFDATGRKAKHEFIEAQIQRLWKEMVESLAEQLSTIEVDVPVAAERSTIGT